MSNVCRTALDTTRALVLGCALTSSLAGCQLADSGAPVRAEAFSVVRDALGKVRAAEVSADALAAGLSGLAASSTGLGALRDTLGAQRQALFSMESALGSYGGRVDGVLACGCADALADFGSSVAAEIAGLEGVQAALGAAQASVAGLAASGSAPAPQVFARKLPSGTELAGAANGIESALVAFVEGNRPVDKTTWFDFDALTFRLGAADLDLAKSKPQLDNISAILAAYPKLQLKIGGYTDDSGPAEANKKLSQGRADAVKAALVASGISPKRLEAEGYGPQFPVCAANDTDACKAQNRRVAVRVTAK